MAIALGGGGSPAPVPELVLEWIALTWLAALVWFYREWSAWPRLALAFAAALLALPAIQLVPLPPALWQALPNRAVETEALRLIGADQRWMPLSISPARTLASLLSLLLPVAVMVTAALAGASARRNALLALVAMGLLSVTVGAGQLAGGPESALRFYDQGHRDVLTGFQANRNAEAVLFLIAGLALATIASRIPAARLRSRLAPIAAAAFLLILGVILTASRAGAALLALVAAGGCAVWLRSAGKAWSFAKKGAIVAALIALVGLLLTLAIRAPALAPLVDRFSATDDPRPGLWRDTLYAIDLHWPWGSGLGTFVPAFVAAEPLEAVDASMPNRAHNDFLELALEGGLPAIALLGGLAFVLVRTWLRRLRGAETAEERSALWWAGASLALLALHSCIDYPLRSMALAALAGFAAGTILGRTPPSVVPAGDREANGS